MKSGLTIEEQVLAIVHDECGWGCEINLDTIVLNATGIGEEIQRDIVMRLEDELEVLIPDEEAEKLVTVKDIVAYITKKKEE